MASYDPPRVYFDNINFNESHFTDNSSKDITLQRMMSVFQNLNQIGITDSNTRIYLSQPLESKEAEPEAIAPAQVEPSKE